MGKETQESNATTPNYKMMAQGTYSKTQSVKLPKWSTTHQHADLSARMQIYDMQLYTWITGSH
jgi:hypothetical protein